MSPLPSNYRGFRSGEAALRDVTDLTKAPQRFEIVRVLLSPDQGPEMAGTGRLFAGESDPGAVSLMLDDTPLISLTRDEVRGGWLSVNDSDDLSLALDFTLSRLHISDSLGQAHASLRSLNVQASRRVARQGVRGWPEVLHDIAAIGAKPRERPDRPLSVVFEPERTGPRRLLSDEDAPSEVSVFVGDSEALRLAAAAFRGAWLWDRGDDTYLDIDASRGRGSHGLLTHQISTVWGLH